MKDLGYNVIVLDKGFVYVGACRRDEDLLYMDNARNITRWGTTEGLHQIVNGGPTKNTSLTPASNVRVPWHAVISLHTTERKLWEKK